MITINKGTGLITGITATASYVLHSYSKKTKTKNLHQFEYFYHESAKQKTWNITDCTCAELTTS